MTHHADRRFRFRLALGWLLAGAALVLLLPVSPASATWGWSGLYWLLVAPLVVLLMPRPPVRSAQALPSRRCSMRRRNSAMMSR